MAVSADLKFLEKMADEAKGIEDRLGNKDNWAKPYYSDLQVFTPGAQRIFVGLNPGGDGGSKKYYKAARIEKKIKSGDTPYFNAYLDESWGGQERGQDSLQIAAKRVFIAMYGNEWEVTLRNTPCFNIIPVCTKNSSDPKLKKMWDDKEYQWGIELIKHLRPETIILYGDGDTRSPWSALKSVFELQDCRKVEVLPKLNYSIKDGTLVNKPLEGTYIFGLPHLSWVNRTKRGISKNLEILCNEIKELKDSNLFI